MGSPLRVWRLSTGLLLVVTVSVFCILVKLGVWQLDRAEQKTAWQATLSARQAASELSFDELLAFDADERLSGYRLSVNATPVNQQILLLDNQVFEGRVGYLAYQVFQISDSDLQDLPWLMVELGFVAANIDRRILPDITPVPLSAIDLNGRVYQKQVNPLSHQLHSEDGNVMRFQNLNLAALAEKIGHPLAPVVLQPDSIPKIALPKPWTPIPLSAQKHQGYALQWFTMAAVFLSLMLWIGWKYLIKATPESTTSNAIDTNNTVKNETKTENE
ncbi:SURF1 family protein [Shewanella sp. KT0246]|uniref:SURF1 family protein n=1 Tax=Shewanella sp. KT0246 TaxID=2815912 RepID=UPI001BC7C990|nr:SURF1 family protein [Shewanella sp. KT0246]GIU51011.1 SURF1-like protein [Shewanella sp. KT0246]